MEKIILNLCELEELHKKIDSLLNMTKQLIFPIKEEWLDNSQFQKKLGISSRTAQNYRDEGKINFTKIGNKIYYHSQEVDRFLKSYSNGNKDIL